MYQRYLWRNHLNANHHSCHLNDLLTHKTTDYKGEIIGYLQIMKVKYLVTRQEKLCSPMEQIGVPFADIINVVGRDSAT